MGPYCRQPLNPIPSSKHRVAGDAPRRASCACDVCGKRRARISVAVPRSSHAAGMTLQDRGGSITGSPVTSRGSFFLVARHAEDANDAQITIVSAPKTVRQVSRDCPRAIRTNERPQT